MNEGPPFIEYYIGMTRALRNYDLGVEVVDTADTGVDLQYADCFSSFILCARKICVY